MSNLNQTFFKTAMQRLSLFRPTEKAKTLLHSLSEVTGYLPLTLMYVEKRMLQEGSLRPLRELLETQAMSQAERLRYKIGLSSHLAPPNSSSESVMNHFNLQIETNRGVVEIFIKIKAKRKNLEFGNERQSAGIEINYKIRTKNTIRNFRQELQLTGISPALGFMATRTDHLHTQSHAL